MHYSLPINQSQFLIQFQLTSENFPSLSLAADKMLSSMAIRVTLRVPKSVKHFYHVVFTTGFNKPVRLHYISFFRELRLSHNATTTSSLLYNCFVKWNK
ncbi:hypothetical protein EB796_005559 [Bugula neritina]|uniref:Uncharacterized protein n=1 Tax=Bugula neritina TaxID=10212 RepID=A0A7J7KE52_BUGNE|nr:hypothetical protein EB796_005559 [Bugula neritina]